MKTLLVIFISFAFLAESSRAISIAIPDIPSPMTSGTEAIAIAQKHLKDSPSDYLLISADWCAAADFKPRVSDGTQWHIDGDLDEYSWFITFVYRANRETSEFEKRGNRIRKYDSVMIIAIKDDGSIRRVYGTRT